MPKPGVWGKRLAALASVAAGLAAACAVREEAPAPRVVPSEAIDLADVPAAVDVDSVAAAMAASADTLPPSALVELERDIRDWLGRLEYEDASLLPVGEPEPRRWFRYRRGLLLDALGRSAFRRGDLRQAEAALTSAVDEIHSRGATAGYAVHFHHLGEVLEARGRRAAAVDAYLDAEVRGMGEAATPSLERAYRRLHGSLRGLDQLRERERERIEDERRQALLEGAGQEPLPAFRWPRRTGAPMESAGLIGRSAVLAVWGDACAHCGGWPSALEPLAEALRSRGVPLIGVWVGAAPAAGPPLAFPLLVPPDAAEARRALGQEVLPALLVVDAAGRIRYRHAGAEAAEPPAADLLFQLDHLRRTVPETRP